MRGIIHCILLLTYSNLLAQSGLFINGDDASFRVDSTSFLSVDGDFYNFNCNSTAYVRFNGPLYLSGSLINNDSLKFSPTTGIGNSKKARVIFRSTTFTPTNTIGAHIGGSVEPVFWEVEFDKGTGNYFSLLNNVKCLDTVTFKTGYIFINGYKWKMIDPVGAPNVLNHPFLKNEQHSCQFLASSLNDTGLVIYRTIYTNSTHINPANIGIEFSGPLNIGSALNIYRGFKPQVNAAKSGILRYYDIYSSGHSLVSNLLKIKYSYADFAYFTPGYLNPSDVTLYVSPNADMNWSRLPSVSQNSMIIVNSTTLNGEMSANLVDLSLPNTNIAGTAFRVTLADRNCINPPISGLLLDTIHICIGSSQILDAGNNSSIPNTSLKWEWNTIPSVFSKTLSVSPDTTFQKYKVKLKDVRGCESTDSVIIAPSAPYPQITYLNHLNACIGDSIQIKDTVKISAGNYSNFYQFSDSDTLSTLKQNFKKLFQTTGAHAFQLIATSNHGCTVTATSSNVIVYPLPTPSFTNSFNCSTGVMTFTNTSVSNFSTLVISASNWNLGQGALNTSTLFSPSMAYSLSGTYNIKLISTNSFGCQDSVSTPITIFPTNQALFTKNNSCLNDTVYFNNISACNTGSCNFEWQFGDGTQSSSFSSKKVYPSTGLFTAKLKMSDPFGCPDSLSFPVFINPNPIAQFASTSTVACLNEFIYLTNTSSISTGSISNYLWNFNNTLTSNSTNAVSTYSIPGLYTISLSAISDSGCVNQLALPILINTQPFAQYTVSSACLGYANQFVSSSVGIGLSHYWEFGNSVSVGSLTNVSCNYIYSTAGNYSTQLIVQDMWGCSDTSYVNASVFSTPTLALGGIVSTCGNSYTLDAGNLGSTYFWQPSNQTVQAISVGNSGLYQVTITNTNGCIGNESVQVVLNANVKPNLGNDTIACGDFKLDAGYPGSSYLWNTSATNQTLIASTTGTYIVQVTDLNSCSGLDTIHVTILSPAMIDLGNNLTICKPKYGVVISPTTNASDLLWSDGTNGPSFKIQSTGIYWCEAILANGCKSRDSIYINFKNTPSVDLGPDKSDCNMILLDAKNYGNTFLWSNGSTEQTLSVNTSSNYFVLVSNNLSGCSQQDSINIIIHPSINLFLGNDTSICSNTNFSLNANNPGAFYNWSTNASTQIIPITSSGIYGVIVTDTNGCNASDYIQISLISSPTIELGNSIQYLCGSNPLNFNITNTGDISWNSNTGLSSASNSISIDQAGKYWVTLNEFGCSVSDTVMLIRTSNTIQASFLASTLDTINRPVKFINLSNPPPISQWWNFGDGTTSTELNPIHTFVLPQNYSITLEVSNGFCVDRLTKELNALFKSQTPDLISSLSKLEISKFLLYPNPCNNYLNVLFELNTNADISVDIIDVCGRLVKSENAESKTSFSPSIDIMNLNIGLYILSITAKSNKGVVSKIAKFIKSN